MGHMHRGIGVRRRDASRKELFNEGLGALSGSGRIGLIDWTA